MEQPLNGKAKLYTADGKEIGFCEDMKISIDTETTDTNFIRQPIRAVGTIGFISFTPRGSSLARQCLDRINHGEAIEHMVVSLPVHTLDAYQLADHKYTRVIRNYIRKRSKYWQRVNYQRHGKYVRKCHLRKRPKWVVADTPKNRRKYRD